MIQTITELGNLGRGKASALLHCEEDHQFKITNKISMGKMHRWGYSDETKQLFITSKHHSYRV